MAAATLVNRPFFRRDSGKKANAAQAMQKTAAPNKAKNHFGVISASTKREETHQSVPPNQTAK